jgi:hypothetical protein
MANFVGAIEHFNPYVQQIPTDAYVKVGMYKEHEYEAGVKRVQDTIDNIAGLDIANEGGRQYLRARVDELTKSLNKYSTIDFSNVNNVTQLVGLAKPLYQDENIVTDVINTGVYRKWSKEAGEAFKAGKMELGQYTRELTDANTWLNSKSAGSSYTGRQAPNTSTKKEILDRIVKYKKDGVDMNEFVYDTHYSKDTPYYVKSTNKYYSEADFNNFIADAVLSDRDREMLMNEHWYENQGVSTEALQQQDLQMYQDKINANIKRIDEIKNDPLLYAGDKKIESQKVIDDLLNYNKQLSEGKIQFLQNLNLNDPTSRDVFHRDLSEARFMNSLGLLRNQVQKEELTKNEQWFLEKKGEIDAALENLKNAAKGTGTGTDKTKKSLDENINEVAVYTPANPDAPKTQVSLSVIQSGWNTKQEEINSAMNSLIGKLGENGVNINEYVAGWDQVQVGGKAGASVQVPRFKDEASKAKFYNLVAGLNYAYTKEAEDGHIDNQSFTKWVKENFAGYKDEDPNSKFTLNDKVVNDALNTLKGTTALLPRLEKLFSDKGVVRTLAQIDEALKDKKDMANAYREALIKSNALTGEEMKFVRTASDDDLLSGNYNLDRSADEKRLGPGKRVRYRVGNAQGYDGSQIGGQEQDGTYSIYRDIYETDETGSGDFVDFGPVKESQKIIGGYKSYTEALKDISRGTLSSKGAGISKESFKKADEFVKQTYSYIQENLNSTAQNLKDDKQRYEAFKSGMATFLSSSLSKAGKDDIEVLGVDNLKGITGIKDIEINTFSVTNTEDIFNPNPKVNITFTATNTRDKEPKPIQYTANISLKSFLATNPDYRSPGYAQYFGPVLYAQKDAYARIKANINPLEGSEASYASGDRAYKSKEQPGNIEPVFNYQKANGTSAFIYDNGTYGGDIQWETIPIEKDGQQTMVSYQVVSLGQNTTLGNIKNKDGNNYAPGAFYIKLKVPTSSGKPQIIFLKKPNGDSYAFNSASAAHYTLRELILNSPDIKLDEINPKGEVNYFTTDPTTLRGIFNTQLSYNGFSKIETVKLKDALGKEITKQQIAADQQTYGR